jgi:hypothetical protein
MMLQVNVIVPGLFAMFGLQSPWLVWLVCAAQGTETNASNAAQTKRFIGDPVRRH